jgi:hypothetical protein
MSGRRMTELLVSISGRVSLQRMAPSFHVPDNSLPVVERREPYAEDPAVVECGSN